MLLAAAALAAALAGPAAPARAQGGGGERESLEQLRRTTLALIEALVQSGALSRERADALIAEARQRAEAAAPARAEPPPVRVPFVPQVVREQMRNEIKEEVLNRARVERWGVPGATAEWTDRIQIDGDLRVRAQADNFGGRNPAPLDFLTGTLESRLTRAPDFAAGDDSGLPLANTQDDRNRARVRVRLGLQVKVADSVTAGLRLATGSATDRVSTQQTLGNNANRYSFLVDRAFVRLDPAEWLTAWAGRLPNPWFGTDLVWSENLNFEGAAASARWVAAPNQRFVPFATLGYFPVRESAPPRYGRSIVGVQVGAQWEASELMRLKLGLAHYVHRYFEGRVDPDYDAVGPGRSYGQYEYEAGLRQRGNTLFLTNNPLDPTRIGQRRWGLASRFEPLALAVAGEFSAFSPVIVQASGEYVRNLAFDRGEILGRTGVALTDGSPVGYQLRTVIGAPELRNRGQWQLALTWRRLGSDAVLDGFTDSDLGLGGTNIAGYAVGLGYAFERNTSVALRYLSARSLASPTGRPGAGDGYRIDTLQLDLHARF
jgi:hypothetical protein